MVYVYFGGETKSETKPIEVGGLGDHCFNCLINSIGNLTSRVTIPIRIPPRKRYC